MKRVVGLPGDRIKIVNGHIYRDGVSRLWGPVPKAWIIGKAFSTHWPPARIGFL